MYMCVYIYHIWPFDYLFKKLSRLTAKKPSDERSVLRLNHSQNPSKSGLPWSRQCCSHWCRVYDDLQSIDRCGRTRGKIRTASDMAKSFELLKILARGQPQAAHMVKMCYTHETHVIIRVPAVIKTWKDAVRGESLGACHGPVSGRVLRVGIKGNSVCLVAYHWQMDFSIGWTWLAVLRQCFSSGTAADGHTPYKARSSQNWPKITTYDHVQQIFITSCTWFRRWQALQMNFCELVNLWMVCPYFPICSAICARN